MEPTNDNPINGVGVAVEGDDGVGVTDGSVEGIGVAIGPGMTKNQSKKYCRRKNLDIQPQGSPWSLLVLLDTTRHFCRKPEP